MYTHIHVCMCSTRVHTLVVLTIILTFFCILLYFYFCNFNFLKKCIVKLVHVHVMYYPVLVWLTRALAL
jgi:hypothetical protein